MAIRLVPLMPTFLALRRHVREQALRLGKELEVEFQGANLELDKAVAERLGDPLKHLVRNALDHGIEAPADRAASASVCTRTREKSWPKPASMSRRTPLSSGWPGRARVRATLAGASAGPPAEGEKR